MVDSLLRPRKRRRRRGLVPALFLTGLAVAAFWLFRGGTAQPTGSLQGVPEVLGEKETISLTLEAPHAGLAVWQLYIRDARGNRFVLAEENLPAGGLFEPGTQRIQREVEIAPRELGLAEGTAELILQATGHAPLSRLGGGDPITQTPFTVDLTPPDLRVLSGPHRILQGGTDLMVYQTGKDAVRSGVLVGQTEFPGSPGPFTDGERWVSLYSVPWNAPGDLNAAVYTEDAAGNRQTRRVPLAIRKRKQRAEEIRISDNFIRTKIEPLLTRYQQPIPETPTEAYLAVNRAMRQESEKELQALLAESAPQLLTTRALQQQRGTQVGSRFAEHRTYTYQGDPIDEQTHLGYDLASVRRAPVKAAGDGQVQWVGELGIYGKIVLIDHGLGLATLYAHLSQIDVEPGMQIARGEVLGRSGESGLAGGDHIHFSVTLRGHHVDPLEWWDAQWVKREILEPIQQAGAQGP